MMFKVKLIADQHGILSGLAVQNSSSVNVRYASPTDDWSSFSLLSLLTFRVGQWTFQLVHRKVLLLLLPSKDPFLCKLSIQKSLCCMFPHKALKDVHGAK